MNMLAQNWSNPEGGVPATIEDFEAVFAKVTSVILGFAGITFFVLLLVGGFKYITSGGDPKAVEGAKKTITLALGGLILILLSYIILRLIYKITGVPLDVFEVVQ
ncbi:hypothetical protein ACFL1Q_00890 [Patescibacteria group bacterium]